MPVHSIRKTLSWMAAIGLAFGVVVTTAHAQMKPMAPMTPPAASPATAAPAAKAPKDAARSNAQLEQEIKALRAQVQELQQAHGMSMDKQPGTSMPNKREGSAVPPVDPPMKKGRMGMGRMEKDDDAMGMPPPDGADSQPMPPAKPHM